MQFNELLRALCLVVATILLVGTLNALNQLRVTGVLSPTTAALGAWVGFFANLAIAAVGAFTTPFRRLWISYGLLSLAVMILIGVSTPLNVFWIGFR